MALFSGRSFRVQLSIDLAIFAGGLAAASIFIVYLAGNIQGRAVSISKAREDLAGRRTVIESLAALRTGAESAKAYSNLLLNILPPRDALINFPRYRGFSSPQ